MKSLLAIFTFCPDTERKLILLDLLKQIQSLRDNYDIIILSHSEIPNECASLCDFIYIESENNLIYDFNLRNKFWLKTEHIFAHTSLIYPFSTHLSIYSLIHYVLNFSKYKKYSKVHCLEYDINLQNPEIIKKVDIKLNEFDNVMFKSSDNWIHGVYIAFKIEEFPDNYFQYDEKFIIEEIQTIETRMTEHYTPKFLNVGERKTHYESIDEISSDGVLQKNDAHGNQELNWCIPIVKKDSDELFLLIFNEKGNNNKIDLLTNLTNVSTDSGEKNYWKLIKVGEFHKTEKVIILVDGKIKHNIVFDESNRKKFIESNYFYYL
jgi:hypothetical protein